MYNIQKRLFSFVLACLLHSLANMISDDKVARKVLQDEAMLNFPEVRYFLRGSNRVVPDFSPSD